MDIKLMGWSCSGLRCPDHHIDLSNGPQPAEVSLIQMPNGTGKTTTLIMLNAALCGEALEWTQEEVRSYRRPGQEINEGSFVVKFKVDEKPLTFELVLDFDSGRANYKTTAPGSGGVVKGWSPPAELKRFFAKEFIRLFVFDGEFAEHLLDPNKAEAERAIDALCQLYLLDEIDHLAEEYWQAATKDKSAKSGAGLTKWKNNELELKTQIKKVEKAKNDGAKKIITLKERISELDKKINTHIGEIEGLNEQHQEAAQKELMASQKVEETVNELMKKIRSPHFLHESFGKSLFGLKHSLDRLKLPENTSKQFFTELAEEDFCVCGRPIDTETKQVILDKATEYLGEDASGVLNALKEDIGVYINAENFNEGPDKLLEVIAELTTAVKDKKIAKQEVRSLKDQLIEQGDTQLEEWQAALKELIKDKKDLEGLLEDINRTPELRDENDPKTRCLQALKKQLHIAVKKVAEISGAIELRAQIDIITDIVRKARAYSRDNIKKALIKECNEKLEEILAEDVLQLDRIDRSLRLKDQDGASVGQTLAVGYTFLTSVLYRGKHDFPLVVDSPANPLDGYKRRKIGNLIPQLCSQFVGFTINTERQDFVTALENSIANKGGKIRYITMFRKTPGTAYLMNNLPKDGVQETINGILVMGREYFNGFNMEEEEEK